MSDLHDLLISLHYIFYGTTYIERSVLRRGIQQRTVQWNSILSKGARVNRIYKCEHKVIIFFKVYGLTFKHQKKRLEERNPTV